MILRYDRIATELPPPSDPDPAGAAAVQELMGGRFGEMSTFMNYTFQSFNFRGRQGARPFYGARDGSMGPSLPPPGPHKPTSRTAGYALGVRVGSRTCPPLGPRGRSAFLGRNGLGSRVRTRRGGVRGTRSCVIPAYRRISSLAMRASAAGRSVPGKCFRVDTKWPVVTHGGGTRQRRFRNVKPGTVGGAGATGASARRDDERSCPLIRVGDPA